MPTVLSMCTDYSYDIITGTNAINRESYKSS